ncbi:cell division ATP-binding protein FtsE [Candidatus Palibaumannia cicadellinicola]|uniref:Cell division ATP-binding protein FtsE n=1 Tax=Baumannia cicadellinicola subsp. Homalodisca coagulata TaxID=374463 RepID=Q1LU29_BAUCH|nr:ATP-binding cassette domain-containing protein [Candidatus Baumannia cicadellinicola]ABF14216.1 cell division ATP-binding protein FtsE [Baumannia cicadellinicola str. Hc (Homalodisca coagulata)]MBS0032595.1 ATP-binding cassette domain-containing protein [Candidatus Baumannia cicadellinicola]MCJ7462493.1 ATP-binding cassette domain-containing protein [Candidatus Baumannia cicadellinicola]
MICFQQVSKSYLIGRQVIQSMNFHIRSSEIVIINGNSGSGKSTLLKLICGLERPNSGDIFFCGKNITQIKHSEVSLLRRQMGIIFPDNPLLLNRTVYENVAIPLVITGASIKNIRRRISAALDKVSLLDKADNFIMQLSNSEKHRVCIARAIVNKPVVLLADEPTRNLDDVLSNSILRLFEEFNRFGVTIIIATHNMKLISGKYDRIINLQQG